MQMEEYGKEQGFILKAPADKSTHFRCPDSRFVIDAFHLYPDFHHSSYAVTPDGRLHGFNITYMHQGEVLRGNFSWDNDKFCVSFADEEPNYESDGVLDYESDGVFELTFNTCYDYSQKENRTEENRTEENTSAHSPHLQSEPSFAESNVSSFPTNKSQALSKVSFLCFTLSSLLLFNLL